MKLKNLLFQPLTLNIALDSKGLHLNAREATDILESRISDEILKAEVHGIVSLMNAVDEGITSPLGRGKDSSTQKKVSTK